MTAPKRPDEEMPEVIHDQTQDASAQIPTQPQKDHTLSTTSVLSPVNLHRMRQVLHRTPIARKTKEVHQWITTGGNISAIRNDGKLVFYFQPKHTDPILIATHDVVGIPQNILKKPKLWKKFLKDTWVRTSTTSDGSIRLYVSGRLKGAGNTINILTESEKLWPGAIVPYEIDTLKYPVGRRERRIILDAIRYWQRQKTGFTFVPKTTQRDYLVFGEEEGVCYSWVGKKPGGGRQYIRCDLDGSGGGEFSVASIVHEIGHVIGLYHEQSRRDRDEHVKIHRSKIIKRARSNFGIAGEPYEGYSYDYASIMHYGRKAFSVDGSDTITPLRDVEIGQRDYLSAGDIATAKYLARAAKIQRGGGAGAGDEEEDPLIKLALELATAGDGGAAAAATADARKEVWRTLHKEGNSHFCDEDYQLAGQYYRALLEEYGTVIREIFPKTKILASIYYKYGRCLYERGTYSEARKHFHTATELDPRNRGYEKYFYLADDKIKSCRMPPGCRLL